MNNGKQEALTWLALPVGDRKPRTKAALARKLGVTPQTISRWSKEPDNGDIDTDDLIHQIEQMDAAVFNAAKTKNIAKMAELWYRRHGLLVDKSEMKVKVGLDADELARIENEARKQLGRDNQSSSGEGEVQAVSTLLPEEIRQNKGRTEGDNSL